MKAFLLAGGRGERLRPLTLSIPKCLVPVNGAPLLGIWLDLLQREGVDDVLLNVSHHVAQVQAFLAARRSGPRVELVVESEPRGNAGTVAAHAGFVGDEESFWIFYADNLTNLSLRPMLEAHARHRGLLTLGLFRAPDPRAAGIVDVEADGRIVGFEEKPAHPRSDLANTGIYLARRDLFGALPTATGILDFGHDVFPRLIGRMYGHVIDAFLMDVGTPTALATAAEAWARLESSAPGEVALVPLTTAHAPAMYRWVCDPEVSGNIGLRSIPTIQTTVAWIERATDDRTVSARAILAGGEHVGNVILDRIDRDLGTARLSIYIGDRRGEGLGARAMRLVLQEAFGPLALHKVWLTVYASNQPARALYAAIGFQVERVEDDVHPANGEPVQVIYMGIHKVQPQPVVPHLRTGP